MKRAIKVMILISALLLLALAGVGTWAYFQFIHTTPLSHSEREEARPDWGGIAGVGWSPWHNDPTPVWYPAKAYNDWVASIPDEERAWPLLVEAEYDFADVYAFEHIGQRPGEYGAPTQALIDYAQSPESDAFYESLSKMLARPHMGLTLHKGVDPAFQDAMERNAEDLPDWHVPDARDHPMLALQLPVYGPQRSVARFLTTRASVELEQGQPDAFVRAIELNHRNAWLTTEFPCIISQLVRVSIERQSLDTIEWALRRHPDRLSDAHLLQLIDIVDESRRAELNITGELLFVHDTLRRVLKPDGRVDSVNAIKFLDSLEDWKIENRLPCDLPFDQLTAVLHRPMLDTKRELQRTIANTRLPWDPSLARAEEETLAMLDDYNLIITLTVGIVWPATESFAISVREHRQHADAIAVALRQHLHQRATGDFTEDIRQLPHWDRSPGIPSDAFREAPLRVALRDEGFTVYSVGTDRDDDAGVSMQEAEYIREVDLRPLRLSDDPNRPFTPSDQPHWLASDVVDEINQQNAPLIDGDWVLYPTLELNLSD